MSKTILVTEDEQVLRESLVELLSDEGYEVLQAANGREAHDLLLQRPVDLILSDIRMPEMDGLALLAHAKQVAPQTPVVMVTAFGTVESAVAAMRSGAHDYLLKPVQFDDLIIKVQRALEFGDIVKTKQVIDDQLAAGSTFHDLVGESKSMEKLFDTVKKLSTVKSNVLIVGESGTGKE